MYGPLGQGTDPSELVRNMQNFLGPVTIRGFIRTAPNRLFLDQSVIVRGTSYLWLHFLLNHQLLLNFQVICL